MKLIRIKAAANISNSLQSTLTYHQALTELVKNAVQSGASSIDIVVSEDNIIISDDGIGFNHNVDDEELTGFEKYFTYGNSYNSKTGSPQLNYMGIGGKISNDKLSHSNDVYWRIDTKNRSGKSFIVDYKPRKVEAHKNAAGEWHVFEEDGTPYMSSDCCYTESELILTSDDIIDLRCIEGFEQVNDIYCKWNQTAYLTGFTPIIKESSQTQVKGDTGTVITILNVDDQLKAAMDSEWIEKLHTTLSSFFSHLVTSYTSKGKSLSITINDQLVILQHPLVGKPLGDITKKFNYTINGKSKTAEIDIRLSIIHKKTIPEVSLTRGIDIVSQGHVCKFRLDDDHMVNTILDSISKERGYKICRSSGVLSPFYNMVGTITCNDLSTVLDSKGFPGKNTLHYSLRDDHPIVSPFKLTVYRELIIIMTDMYLRRKQSGNMREDNNIIASNIAKLINDSNTEYLWHSIEPFGSGKENLASRIIEANGQLCVCINSGNPKFISFDQNNNTLCMALHIAECMIRELIQIENQEISKEVLDEKISEFYSSHFYRITSMDLMNINIVS